MCVLKPNNCTCTCTSRTNTPHNTCSGNHNTRITSVVYRSSDLHYHDNNIIMVVVLVEDMEYNYSYIVCIVLHHLGHYPVYAKTFLSGTMECYHQSTAVDVYTRHSQVGWSMNIFICACLA